MALPLGTIATAGTLLGVSAYAGLNTYKNDGNDPDALKHGTQSGIRTAEIGGLAIGATALAYSATKMVPSSIKSDIVKHMTSSRLNSIKSMRFNKASLTRPLTLGVGGAALGGYLGSKIDPNNPGRGAVEGVAVGAGAGVLASAAIKGAGSWSKMGPVGKTGAILGGALAIGIGARATMHEDQYESTSEAFNDDMGSNRGEVDRSGSYGVRRRLETMNASGDIVLGLNNKRR